VHCCRRRKFCNFHSVDNLSLGSERSTDRRSAFPLSRRRLRPWTRSLFQDVLRSASYAILCGVKGRPRPQALNLIDLWPRLSTCWIFQSFVPQRIQFNSPSSIHTSSLQALKPSSLQLSSTNAIL
jgi:hypothetical protein